MQVGIASAVFEDTHPAMHLLVGLYDLLALLR